MQKKKKRKKDFATKEKFLIFDKAAAFVFWFQGLEHARQVNND